MNNRQKNSVLLNVLTCLALIAIFIPLFHQELNRLENNFSISDIRADDLGITLVIDKEFSLPAVLVTKEDREEGKLSIKILDRDYRWSGEVRINFDFTSHKEALVGMIGSIDKTNLLIFPFSKGKSSLARQKLNMIQKVESPLKKKRLFEELVRKLNEESPSSAPHDALTSQLV